MKQIKNVVILTDPQKIEERIDKLFSIPSCKEYLETGFDGPIRTINTGKPRSAEKIIIDEELVLRHYVQNESDLESILGTGSFLCGKIPYTVTATGSRHIWSDLVGVFFTNTGVAPSSVGVPYSNRYCIEVVLPTGTPVIKLEENIFLIPLERDQILDISEVEIKFYTLGAEEV